MVPLTRAALLSTLVPTTVGLLLGMAGCASTGDHGVAVSSSAREGYTRQKYAAGVRPESYVFMPGHFFGGATADRSLEQLPFRRLAEFLAPELAKRQYWPAKGAENADLVLVVHWGVTSPAERMDKLLVRDPPNLANLAGPDANTGVDYSAVHTVNTANEQPLVSDAAVAELFSGTNGEELLQREFQLAEERTDAFGSEYSRANAMKLLGYGRHLRKTENTPAPTAEELMLRFDLEHERYFIVVQAYDLRKARSRKPPLVWTLHLNMSSAGNNFGDAVALMSGVAARYVGRDLDRVETELPGIPSGNVQIGEITIVGEK